MKYIFKKALLFFAVNFIFFFHLHLCAQPTPNHLNLRVGLSGMQFHGKEFAQSGSFISPALFPNYQMGWGLNLMAEVRLKPFMGAGIKILSGSSSGWEMTEHTLYSGSTVNQLFIAPTLRLNTTSANISSDVFMFYLDISPGVGRSTLTMETPIMQVISSGGDTELPLKETGWYTGVMASVGTEINLTHGVAAFAAWSFGYSRIEGALFNDTGFRSSLFEVGIVFRLLPVKDYYRL